MKHFEKINWLPISERLNQYLCSNAFKFCKETCPLYLHDIYIYRQSGQNQANMRYSVLKLKHPSRNTCSGLKKFLYLTPIVWNILSTDLKLVNNFKHKLKDHFFQKLRNMEQNTFAYGHCIGNLTVTFSINLSTISLNLSTIHNVIMFYVNIFK